MTDKALVYVNNDLAGYLSKDKQEFTFRYDELYFLDPKKKAISVTLPKARQEYKSNYLFPFFFNMLSEGANKQLQCRQLQIDENDYFSLLIATGSIETIGAVTVKSIQ